MCRAFSERCRPAFQYSDSKSMSLRKKLIRYIYGGDSNKENELSIIEIGEEMAAKEHFEDCTDGPARAARAIAQCRKVHVLGLPSSLFGARTGSE